MFRIIANADDFGRHELINRAVSLAVERGILRSATLMPGGRAFADAVDTAKRQPKLGVGIHFTLVNGYPVLPPREIPSLVTTEGVFYDDYTIFVQRYLQGKINLSEVRAELAAQLRKVQGANIPVTHADSHQHMHTLPGVLAIVLDLLTAANIKAVRSPKAPLLIGRFGGLKQFIGRWGLGTLARFAAYKAKKKGRYTPDHFGGIVAGEAIDEDSLGQILLHLAPGTTEIMLHPGTDNKILQSDCKWTHDFAAELKALTSPAITKLAQEHNIACINFAEAV